MSINDELTGIEAAVKELRQHVDSLYEIAKRAGVVERKGEDYGLLLGTSHDSSSAMLHIGYHIRKIREQLR